MANWPVTPEGMVEHLCADHGWSKDDALKLDSDQMRVIHRSYGDPHQPHEGKAPGTLTEWIRDHYGPSSDPSDSNPQGQTR